VVSHLYLISGSSATLYRSLHGLAYTDRIVGAGAYLYESNDRGRRPLGIRTTLTLGYCEG